MTDFLQLVQDYCKVKGYNTYKDKDPNRLNFMVKLKNGRKQALTATVQEISDKTLFTIMSLIGPYDRSTTKQSLESMLDFNGSLVVAKITYDSKNKLFWMVSKCWKDSATKEFIEDMLHECSVAADFLEKVMFGVDNF